MSVLGAGLGSIDLESRQHCDGPHRKPIPRCAAQYAHELGIHRRHDGGAPSLCALIFLSLIYSYLRHLIFSPQHLASLHPSMAFIHIHPGVVRTSALKVDFDGIFTPLTWFLNWLFPLSTQCSSAPIHPYSYSPTHYNPQDECAEHMLYALFNGEVRTPFLKEIRQRRTEWMD